MTSPILRPLPSRPEHAPGYRPDDEYGHRNHHQ
jgi:hypothetical protein